MKKIFLIGAILLASLAFFTACDGVIKKGYVGNSLPGRWEAKFNYYDGVESKKISLSEGEEILIDCDIELEEGSIKIIVLDSNDNEVKVLDSSGEINLKVEKSQRYTLKLIATKAKGNFSIEWTIS